jgi:hypothetical protein
MVRRSLKPRHSLRIVLTYCNAIMIKDSNMILTSRIALVCGNHVMLKSPSAIRSNAKAVVIDRSQPFVSFDLAALRHLFK